MDYTIYKNELMDARFEGAGLSKELKIKLLTYLDVINSGLNGGLSREHVYTAQKELYDVLGQLEKT
jgi:hypothetical protein